MTNENTLHFCKITSLLLCFILMFSQCHLTPVSETEQKQLRNSQMNHSQETILSSALF